MSKSKIYLLICILCLTISQAVLAVNVTINNYQAAREIFWDEIYADGGWTIYCGNRIEGRSPSLSIEHVYPMSWVSDSLKCGSRGECRIKSDLYNRIESDFHNFYPARLDSNRRKSNLPYGIVEQARPKLKDCDMKIDNLNRLVQPADEVSGDVARAIFYILFEYNLNLPAAAGSYDVLLQWNKSDPPDQFEQNRNREIEKLIGTSNIFIEHPGLAETLLKHNIQRRQAASNKNNNDISVSNNYTGKDLINHDFSEMDLSYANMQGANLEGVRFYNTKMIGVNLSGASLKNTRFKNTDLSNAVLRKTKLKDVVFVNSKLNNIIMQKSTVENVLFDRSVLDGVVIVDSRFIKSNIRNTSINNSKFRDGGFSESTFFNNTNIKNTKFNNVFFQRIRFVDSSLKGAVFDFSLFNNVEMIRTDLTNAVLDLNPNSLLKGAEFSQATGLQNITFHNTPNSLISIRKGFKDSGLRHKERELTYAIESTKTRNADTTERWFRYVLFDLSSEYGLSYGRPLFLIGIGVLVFSLFYIWPIRNPGKTKILYIEPIKGTGDEHVSTLEAGNLSAILWSLYFSIMSAFHIGWRDLNVGNWLNRMQTKQFVLVGEGWIRTVSGIQSLVSVYLLAIWALSYFGRPFQ